MSETFAVPVELLEQAQALIEKGAAEGFRPLIGIAGPPASGKTTLAHALAEQTGGIAVPMDGFHLDNPILEARGLRDRKGAPETFDAGGFLALVQRLKKGDEVFAPLFDRERELAIAGALAVPEEAPLVVLEGNYLLLDEPVWRDVAALLDLSVLVVPPIAEIERRLMQRWLNLGFDGVKARAWIESNDLPNAMAVMARSSTADLTFGG